MAGEDVRAGKYFRRNEASSRLKFVGSIHRSTCEEADELGGISSCSHDRIATRG